MDTVKEKIAELSIFIWLFDGGIQCWIKSYQLTLLELPSSALIGLSIIPCHKMKQSKKLLKRSRLKSHPKNDKRTL